MNDHYYTDYSPVSLCPAAPGWRAAYLNDDGSIYYEELIAWGVFDVTERACTGNPAPDRGASRQILGVVHGDFEDAYADPPDKMGNFLRCVPPGALLDDDEIARHVKLRVILPS